MFRPAGVQRRLGGARHADPRSLAGGKGWAEPIVLTESSKLKIAFSIVDTATDEAVVPQQAYIVFEDEERGTDVTVQLGVKDNGKASYILVGARSPAVPALRRSPIGRLW